MAWEAPCEMGCVTWRETLFRALSSSEEEAFCLGRVVERGRLVVKINQQRAIGEWERAIHSIALHIDGGPPGEAPQSRGHTPPGL